MNFRTAYKVLRSILVVAMLVVAMLYVGLYVVLSVPGVQNSIRGKAEKELSSFLKSEVKIKKLTIMPFNELRLNGVNIKTPEGEDCVSIDMLGAGIRIWDLISKKKIVITYAEIDALDGRIWKETKDSPLNIDFIIKAFAPKDKNKPPTKFDVKIHSVAIRKSRLSYDLRWKQTKADGLFDPAHIALSDIRADLTLPVLKNNDFKIDLRRLSFKEKSGLNVDKISLIAHVTNKKAEIENIHLRLPNSEIAIGDFSLAYDGFDKIVESAKSEEHLVEITCDKINPVDFICFYPKLKDLNGIYSLRSDISGNASHIVIEQFLLKKNDSEIIVDAKGAAQNIDTPEKIKVDVEELKVAVSEKFNKKIVDVFLKNNSNINKYITKVGDLRLDLSGDYSNIDKSGKIDADLDCDLGDLIADLEFCLEREREKVSGVIDSREFNIGSVIDSDVLGKAGIHIEGEGNKSGKDFNFAAELAAEYLEFKQHRLDNIKINASKENKEISLIASIEDEYANIELTGDALLDDENSALKLDIAVNDLLPSIFDILPNYQGYHLSGMLNASLTGNNIDNIAGSVAAKDLNFYKNHSEGIGLNSISIIASPNNLYKEYVIDSDFLSGHLTGNFTFAHLADMVKGMISSAVPAYVDIPNDYQNLRDNAHFDLTISPDDRLAEFFKLPLRPYSPISIDGYLDGRQQRLNCNISMPYLLQGSSKLIRDNRINLTGEFSKGVNFQLFTTVPVKNDEASVSLTSMAFNNNIMLDAGWKFVNNKTADGKIETGMVLRKNPQSSSPDIFVDIYPSGFRLNGAEWDINRSSISYLDKKIIVDDLRVQHGAQYVNIDGCASASDIDELEVNLAGIDLGYVFDVLNINYVAFGGVASGRVVASSLFSKEPKMATKRFDVKNFSYNNAVLGDAKIRSRWNNEEKEVEINADILSKSNRTTKIDGGIFVTRDSLSFEMDADHVNIGILKPFMSAFTSDVGGEASGNVKLFGTFKDIDLTGRVFADSICMKVDYTNVYYHGSDSVIMTPGRIDIPEFKLYDKEGHSGNLRGVVKHDYFHNPEFEFKLSNVKDLLCYDTNPNINPDWYGRIHASGSGQLRGRPGIVSLNLDMTTSAASDFTFVLSENQTAVEYNFLTFSDKKKKLLEEISADEEMSETIKLNKQIEIKAPEKPTLFTMDIRCSVTPDARMNLIMDPIAGDKITAHGGGPLQISYNTDTEEMLIYGKYTLDEGFYNFSLQDLILRDFKIKKGSSISFNGDPLQGVLDITAAYRVNTNLSDLDKSFATDRELNRTNVPVDALLIVTGDMTHPDINFDITLPTLTQDVTRKVKSIISTEDMMTRQILYLLALNRFYTPEYMGSSSNGTGELASVASTTLSSQLSNFVGRLTDKFSFSPTFRSDKGDFSDMEVDVALSSRLLDNRLLVNGNFGYRDRATSQTTFIGDFDIEYLLNRTGDLRLKAYNHFNDQNYYLRSSLTTQGIGVIYRKDFDNPFTFLKRKRKSGMLKEENEDINTDSLNNKGID